MEKGRENGMGDGMEHAMENGMENEMENGMGNGMKKYHPDSFRDSVATFTPKISNSPRGLKMALQITAFFLPVRSTK